MNDQERAAALTRMLAEAVEPVQPAPGAQTRLLARVRTRSRRGHPFRWVAAGLTATAVVIAAVFFAGRLGHDTGSSSASSIGSPVSSGATGNAAGPSQGATGVAPDVVGVPVPTSSTSALSAPKAATDPELGTNKSNSAAEAQPGFPRDLDGDGRPDTFTIDRGTLVVQLSRAGVQAVRLPATGAGAGVSSVTTLDTLTGGSVPVAFVRLQSGSGGARYTAVALVNGWLTVLRLDGKPVQLRVDAQHGYGCSQRELSIAGQRAAYVVSGNQLVPSPKLRAAFTPTGRVTGC